MAAMWWLRGTISPGGEMRTEPSMLLPDISPCGKQIEPAACLPGAAIGLKFQLMVAASDLSRWSWAGSRQERGRH